MSQWIEQNAIGSELVFKNVLHYRTGMPSLPPYVGHYHVNKNYAQARCPVIAGRQAASQPARRAICAL